MRGWVERMSRDPKAGRWVFRVFTLGGKGDRVERESEEKGGRPIRRLGFCLAYIYIYITLYLLFFFSFLLR